MESVTIKSLTFKPTLRPPSGVGAAEPHIAERRFLTPMTTTSGKLIYSYPEDFFKLSDLSDVHVELPPQNGQVLTYTAAASRWTNKTHTIIPREPLKTFHNVNADCFQIKEYTHTVSKIRVKTTHVFTIHNDSVCRNSLIFITVRAAVRNRGEAIRGVAAAVKCIHDGFFEVILVNYKPEQKVKKNEYKISYFIINR